MALKPRTCPPRIGLSRLAPSRIARPCIAGPCTGLPLLAVSLLFAAALPAAAGPGDLRITGELGGSEDLFGWSVAAAGDVDGDSFLDLLLGAPSCDEVAGFSGRAYLFYGPFTGDLQADQADAIISAPNFGDNLGISVASAGDTNGDGKDDILIGARSNDAGGIQAGQAYLFRGPITGQLSPSQATAVITGEAFEEIGVAVRSAGDLNGDGFGDIVLGAHMFQAGVGRAYVFLGPVSGARLSASADAIITGEFSSDSFGLALAASDVNGDGLDDLLVGAPHGPIDFLDPGRAYLFFGPVSGAMNASAADVIFRGESNNDMFGMSVDMGDMNGDGLADCLVGASQLFNQGSGRAYLFLGPFTAGSILVGADAQGRFAGEVSRDMFGDAVASAGDVNGDGLDDVLVGAWDQGSEHFRAGRAYLFLGPATGFHAAADADLIVSGEESGDRLGKSVSTAGDLNGNGLADLLIGAPEFPVGDPGKAFIDFDPLATAAIAEAGAPPTPGLRLAPNTPNPFTLSTTLHYALPVAGRVTVSIYTPGGALVRRLVDDWQPGGEHAITWDGRTARGAEVGSGVYFARLAGGHAVVTRRLVLAR
jgi:FG-GAP repeat/FlgD Ig-like domain/FG-GAP-like repeat